MNYCMGDQVVRSGTSIGANIVEAIYAQSDADFLSKISIALKEAAETLYWLKLLQNNDYITTSQADSILSDCDELVRLLVYTKKKKQESVCNKTVKR